VQLHIEVYVKYIARFTPRIFQWGGSWPWGCI